MYRQNESNIYRSTFLGAYTNKEEFKKAIHPRSGLVKKKEKRALL
jgi:hypothetical protein